ncbi:MAG: efflux transporter outer membrane subunit [Acidobacteriota bacterium]|nr:MAG: efflux transporter outer membrane subunit [Acidobacteriota bacterium]
MNTPWLLPLLLLSFIAGCVKAPPVETPELPLQAPAVWTTGEEVSSELDPEWWRTFGDEKLNSVVAEALETNYDLAIAAARLEQAAADAKVAAADLYPQVHANLNGSRLKQNFVGFPIPGGEGKVLSSLSTGFGLNVEVSWEVDLWGRISAQARASLASYQATAADLDGARLSIAGQTVKSWFAVAEAVEQLRLAEATLTSYQESTYQVRERYEAGIRPSLDYRLSLANLAAAEANLFNRRQQLDLAQRQLEVLLGRYPGADIQAPVALGVTPPEIPAGLPAELVARRPDLAAAERRLAASGELVSVARRARYPSISLTTAGGTVTGALTDLLDGNFTVWSLVGNLVQPIFEGGRIRANIERADAGEDEGLAAYINAVLTAYLEVERALAAEEFLADRETALAEASGQSIAAERLADDRYRSGLEDYVTVLESQRRSFDAESALISVRRVRLDNRVDLYLSLGGGFDRYQDPELAPETENDSDNDNDDK